MEKLLLLLNEYQPLESKNQEYCIEGTELYIKTKVYAEADDYLNYTPWVISKKFGFIQWLYDEQKIIDDNKMSEVNIIELEDKASGIITDYSLTSENVIMLLAIQDDPISFLVSVLK